MNFEYSPYVLPLIGAACVALVVIFHLWKRRAVNGAYPLLLMAVGIFEWTFAYALEIMGADLQTKYFWGALQYFGIAFVPYGWLLFSVSFANLNQFLSRRVLAFTGTIPLLTLLFAFTNQWHGLIWSEYHVQQNGSFSALGTSYGIWFWVHVGYSYIILLVGTIFVIRALWRKPGAYRGQMLAMLVAVFAPWLGNALYLTGKSPIAHLDLTPFAFTVTVAALTWAIFGFRLMDIKPLARERIMDLMRDGMIILNLRDKVVDINSAGAQMIGVPIRSAIGKSADEIFHPWHNFVEQIHNSPEIQTEISVGYSEAQRVYEARVSLLKDEYGQPTGRIVTLHLISGDEVLQPRPAAQGSGSRTLGEEPHGQDAPPGGFWFAEFFAPRKKTIIPLDARYSPDWARTLEWIFSVVMRIVAMIGTIAAMAVLPGMRLRVEYWLPLLIIIVLFWTLTLWRTLKLRARTGIFLLALYGLAIMEVSNYGYSVEAFIYFVAIVVFGTLFEDLAGGIATLLISLAILVGFGISITQGVFQPLGMLPNEILQPDDLRGMFTTLTAYLAATVSLIAFISVLLRSLNRAWQTELQALNLLQQERDLLEQRVTERTRDLADARDQALEASRLKSHLLARVSHELRTPLGGVLGYAELVEGDIFGKINLEQRSALRKIIESTNYLTGIVNDLLDAAEIEAGRMKLNPVVFPAEALLKQVTNRLTVLAQQKGLKFETEIVQPFPEKLYGDERRIQQILVNLASNAIKFTASGGVTIRFQQPSSGQWSLEVTDTGMGIPMHEQQNIFFPFQQLNEKITRDNRGTGLGLSIVKQIVDLMGGFIELKSEQNQGSTFVVTLPILQPQETA